MDIPEEDEKALEEALEAYRLSQAGNRNQKTVIVTVTNAGKETSTPLEAGSPRAVGFTIEDSLVEGEGSTTLPNAGNEGRKDEGNSADGPEQSGKTNGGEETQGGEENRGNGCVESGCGN